jgi:hypothetical protein
MKLITKQQAKDLGLKEYFTGKPCKSGGISPRSVSEGRCLCDICKSVRAVYRISNIDEIKKMNSEWREKNKEKWLAGAKRYRDENAELIRIKKAKYYNANSETINARKNELYRKNPDFVKAKVKKYRYENPDKVAATAKAYRERNSDNIAKKVRQWRSENKDKVKNYIDCNKDKFAAKYAKRRARKLAAVPKWTDELDELILLEASNLAMLRTKSTGISWHVDHMIPLAAKNACGLHVGINCQVIPAYLNIRKSNKMIMTEPNEWILYL